MIATTIIVFREVLEAALIVSILMAACRGVPHRNAWILTGIGGGLIGALLVAGFAAAIADAASGIGQELMNAGILMTAVAMLAWHSLWMASHGRELAREAGGVGKAVSSGSKSFYAIAIAVGAAVMREGAETVLFLYGVATGKDGVAGMIGGGVLGTALGVGTGALLYVGLLKIPMRHLFGVTNAMILFLMAGMAAQAAGFLVQADVLPPLLNPAWDTSSVLSEKSLMGKVLHGLIGYEARPAGIQVVFYMAILMLAALVSMPRRAAAVATSVLLAVAVVMPPVARAEFKVRYPNIDYREIEIENNASYTFDKRANGNNHDLSFPTEIGVGVLPFWFVELELETAKHPGRKTSLDAVTFENYFMLTEPGKYFLDFSIFAEYAHVTSSEGSDTAKLGVLLQKDHAKFLHTLNLYVEKEVGAAASTANTFQYAWQTRYQLSPLFQPGFEIYGQIEDLNHPGKLSEQELRIGPMFAGSYNLGQLGGRGKIKYELGYLFGVTNATEDGAIRTRIEYEVGF